jgi:hypothetical protein
MTILRVLLVASPVANEALAWGLFDAAGACVRTGRSIASEWPPADRVEAVLAASQVRIASVALRRRAARVAAATGSPSTISSRDRRKRSDLAGRQAPDGRCAWSCGALDRRRAAGSPALRFARSSLNPISRRYRGWRCALRRLTTATASSVAATAARFRVGRGSGSDCLELALALGWRAATIATAGDPRRVRRCGRRSRSLGA